MKLRAAELATRLTFLWQKTRIVSYPNSGRTWLRVMLADLGAWPRFTHAQSKFGLGLPPADISQGMEKFTKHRVLMLIREPKDTVVSNFYQVTQTQGNWQGDFKTFIRHPNYGFERIIAFNRAWIKAQETFRGGYHLETYEDMRADTEGSLRQIVEFLNIYNVSRGALKAIADKNQFEKLKRREESGELFALHGDRFSQRDVNNPNQRKVRKGRIGGHAEIMDTEDIEFCDAIIAKYGYNELVPDAPRKGRLHL